MGVVLVSNTFDFHDDIKSEKKTFAVRFGQMAAVRLMANTTVVACLSIIIGVLTGTLPVWTLIVLITIPFVYDAVKYTAGFADETRYKTAMTKSITLSFATSILLIVAYLIVILFEGNENGVDYDPPRFHKERTMLDRSVYYSASNFSKISTLC